MNDEEHKIPDWFQDIEGYVRQYCELKRLSSQLAEVLRVPFTEETTTRMGVRISVERDIRSRMDYLEEIITLNVVKQFEYLGILSKFPELHTSHNEKWGCNRYILHMLALPAFRKYGCLSCLW